jgi:NAD(P)H-nitrite reductase large subunit
LGHEGTITIIGSEPLPPYQRPPLSKAYLLGDMGVERLTLRAPDWWEENAITLRLGTSVTAIDTEAQRVTLSDGESLAYSELAICTGATPRRLPAATSPMSMRCDRSSTRANASSSWAVAISGSKRRPSHASSALRSP